MYKKIVNPITGRKVNINSKVGKKILKNYVLFGGNKCNIIGQCGDDSFCINNKCEMIDESKIESGASKKVYLTDNSDLVYSQETTTHVKRQLVKNLIQEHITKEFMNIVFDYIYDNIETQYKSYIPKVFSIEKIWINPIPEKTESWKYFDYDLKYSEKNIFKQGYKNIMETKIPQKDFESLDKEAFKKTRELQLNDREKYKKILKDSEDKKADLLVHNAGTSESLFYDIRLRLSIANMIMNSIGIKHNDIHPGNVFYNKTDLRLCYIDWGRIMTKSRSNWYEDEGYSNNYFGNFVNRNIEHREDPIISVIKDKVIVLIDELSYSFKDFLKIGLNSIKSRIFFPVPEHKIFISDNLHRDFTKLLMEAKDEVDNENYDRAEFLEDLLIEVNDTYPDLNLVNKSLNDCICLNKCEYINYCDRFLGLCYNKKKCKVNPKLCRGKTYDKCS